LSALIHECRGFEQQHFPAIYQASRGEAFKLGFPSREIMVLGDSVEDKESNIMTVAVIFGPWVPETTPDFHNLIPTFRV